MYQQYDPASASSPFTCASIAAGNAVLHPFNTACPTHTHACPGCCAQSTTCLQVHNNEDLTHGAFLLNKEVKQAIRAEVRALLASSGSTIMGLAQQLSVLVQPAAAAGAGLQSRASSVVRSALRRVQSVHLGSGRRRSSGDGSRSPEGAGLGRHKRKPSNSFTEGCRTELGASQQKSGSAGAAAGSSLGQTKSVGADAAAAADRKL
jgi:Arc/MetJ-type ribon-helix-helix transcriptional regulator